jgi:hypothetical protein
MFRQIGLAGGVAILILGTAHSPLATLDVYLRAWAVVAAMSLAGALLGALLLTARRTPRVAVAHFPRDGVHNLARRRAALTGRERLTRPDVSAMVTSHPRKDTLMTNLRYDTLLMRREGLTRDLPPGDNEDLRWVTNSATLIFGDQDAVLVDTFTTIEQNESLIQWVP